MPTGRVAVHSEVWRLCPEMFDGLNQNTACRWKRSAPRVAPRVKFHSVNMSASWFLVSNVFDLDFGVQSDLIEKPIRGNSVGSGNHTDWNKSMTSKNA